MWTVGDLRNSQNITHFGDADQNLQLESQILLQQLEESKQKIILTSRRADRDIQQVNSRIEETERTLQNFLKSHPTSNATVCNCTRGYTIPTTRDRIPATTI